MNFNILKSKKGNQGLAAPFYAAIGIVLAVVILSVIGVVAFNITDNLKASQTAGSYAANTTAVIQSGLSSLFGNVTLWVLVGGAAITLSILFVGLGAFMYMRSQ
jgi:uncharacterized protein (UPF0333 family)